MFFTSHDGEGRDSEIGFGHEFSHGNGLPKGLIEKPIKKSPSVFGRRGRPIIGPPDPRNHMVGSVPGKRDPLVGVLPAPYSSSFDITVDPPQKDELVFDDLETGQIIEIVFDEKTIRPNDQLAKHVIKHRAVVVDLRPGDESARQDSYLDVVSIEPGINFGVASTASAIEAGLAPMRLEGKELGLNEAWTRFTRTKLASDETVATSPLPSDLAASALGVVRRASSGFVSESGLVHPVEVADEDRSAKSLAVEAMLINSALGGQAPGFQRDLKEQL